MRGRTLYIIVAGVVVLAVLAGGASMTVRSRDRARFLENREVTGWEKAGMASDMIGLMTPDIRGASIIPQRDRDAKLIEEILGVIDTEYANSHAVPSYRGFRDMRSGRPDPNTVPPPSMDARDEDGLWEERRREFQAPAQSEPVSGEASPLDISPEDPIPGLLGKSLGEIEQAMGRPDDSGHSDQFG
ncbi:MAG: hypothetical protein R6U92_03840, partial [Bacillota bacterium]